MGRQLNEITYCYLCGRVLSEPVSYDHIPPQQFFAPTIRKAHSPQLLTVLVHDRCNKAYHLDEDYFVHTLMPFGRHSYAGRAIYDHVLAKYRHGEKVGLTRAVLKEFEPRPSGLILPGNKVIKRFTGKRLQRVVWKIVRGLYFHHHGVILPETQKTWVSLTPRGEVPPEHFKMFMALPNNDPHGLYPGVFDYRFQQFTDDDEEHHYWALLIWDSVIFTVVFRNPIDRHANVEPGAPVNSVHC